MTDSTEHAWKMLSLGGALFLVVGLLDVLLAWIPLHIGTPEWEFGTISSTVNNLAVPTMGLVLVAAGAEATGEAWKLLTALGIAAVLAIFTAVMLVLYGLTAPLALSSVQDGTAKQVLMSGILKGGVSLLAYGAVFVMCAFRMRSAASGR